LRIGHRRSVTKRTTPEEDASIPLHTAAVPALSLDKVRAVLSPSARRRLDELLLQLELTAPSDETSPISASDADQLLRDGIIAEIPRSEVRSWTTPFSVREEKESGPRRRLVVWPKSQNMAVYAAGFSSATSMQHVSAYLHAVEKPFGLTRDLKVGFWQIPLDNKASRNFCFSDSNGRCFRMLRLPMGHSCSVDIQEIVTGAISGSLAFCKPGSTDGAENTLSGPVPDIWVDGARWAGSFDQLQAIALAVDARAKTFGATWKECTPPSASYDFIGVHFDHHASTVRVADKTLAKIPPACPTAISPRHLEQLVGRLLFAGGVVSVPIAKFFLAIKWCRRVFNRANATLNWTDAVHPPPSVASLLSTWCHEASRTRTWHKPTGSGIAHLFTDSTLVGWGAVFVSPDNAVFATGGHFGGKEFTSINAAECDAVRLGVESFFDNIKTAAVLRVVVDNTSTSSDLISGKSNSAELAASVAKTVDALQALKGTRISLSYVMSQENPADLPSRAPLSASALTAVQARVRSLASKPLPFAWSRVLVRPG
jgi:hypothetical protein